MSLQDQCNPQFAGHQTFHPRFGWLKKGLDAATKDSAVFRKEDATLKLGVGKNMVEAINFWCQAFRLVVRVKDPEQPRQSLVKPTQFGLGLLGKQGFDPYLEDISTLWILHWKSLSKGSRLPIWWSSFNTFSAVEFTEQELRSLCAKDIAETNWKAPKDATIRKDVDCLLRMYSVRKARGRQTIDDLLDSPFRELRLITPSPSIPDAFRFANGPKTNLPPAAVLFATLDYLATTRPGAKTVSTYDLAVARGAPGRAFKLSEDALLESLEVAVENIDGVALTSAVGSVELALAKDPNRLAYDVLRAHHLRSRQEFPDEPPWALTGPDARQSPTRSSD